MNLINAISGKVLHLGRRGENLATGIVFDYDNWYREYGEGTLNLIARRPGETSVYLAELVDDPRKHQVTWEVTNVDTSYAGSGRCELQYRVNDILVKSEIFGTTIDPCLDGMPQPVNPSVIIIEQILELVQDAHDYADAASRSAQDAEHEAGTAAQSAEAAEQSATAAAASQEAIEDLEVDATTLPAQSEATVAKSMHEGHVKLTFGIPGSSIPTGEQGQFLGYNAQGNAVPISPDSAPTNGSANLVTSDGIYDALAAKQNTLSFDNTPTVNSSNPVKSGGVYSAIQNAIASIPKAIVWRGAVHYYSELPIKAEEGDAYTVLYQGDKGEEPDGTEYVWGELDKTYQWIALGPDLTTIIELINTKQDLLKFDDKPTLKSENPVTSDGIFTALEGKQDILTFDREPRKNSTNPVESGGVFSALASKQDTLTFDNAPTNGSSNPVKSGGVYSALSGKQDTLTFDNAPADGSSNPVTSDGIYDALATKQDTLTFDSAPTEGSSNPVTSDGIYDALADKQDVLTLDSAPTEASINPIESGGVYTALQSKQDTLTFDDSPTDNSSNPVKSSGVYSALTQKSDKVTEVTVSGGGTIQWTIDANKIYHFTSTSITTLRLTLNATDGLAQYHFDFKTTNNTSLVLADTINIGLPGTTSGGVTTYPLLANMRYEVDILNSYGVVNTWSL